jgi:hypothetical protein
MTGSVADDEVATRAEKKGASGHPTERRADPARCSRAGANGLIAQAVADYFHERARDEP